MTRALGALLTGVLALLLVPCLGAPKALASEVRVESSARTVAVGEPFTVEVTAVLDDGQDSAEAPKLPVQGQAQVAGPSIMTQRRMVMHNFSIKTERNIVATYQITPTQKGRLVLGPASFRIGGQRLSAEMLTVEVVDGPAPGSPRSRSLGGRDPFGFGFDPFGQDPFGRDPSSQDPFDGFRQRSGLSGYPEAPPELALAEAPNPLGFLVARLNRATAVLGEPVVVSIYAYGGRGAFREVSPTEPALADFLSYPSVETSHEQPFFRTEVGGREFLVVKLRELVLVPLRTGELEIGSMRAFLRGRGYPNTDNPLGTPASSPPIHLTVREPPLTDRPPGYRLGDVGRFDLSATVTPREVSEQDFVSVRLELSGRGNLPGTLHMPEVPGVLWGEPTVRGEVDVDDRELVGKRVLEYTAKLTRPGAIDLGTVSLPHFDADTKRYRVASATLGVIQVAAAPAAPVPTAPSAPTAAEPDGRALLLGLAPRRAEAPWHPARTAPPLWALSVVVALPGLAWLLGLLPAALSALRRRLGQRSTKKHLDLSTLSALEKSGEPARVASALERAIYGLIEEKTGLRARAILKEHLGARLSALGLDAELASDLQALLVSLESARFLTGTAPGSLVEQAKPLLTRLSKLQSAKGEK